MPLHADFPKDRSDDVLQPVLRHLGLKAQEELGVFLDGLATQAARFDERQAAILARRAATGRAPRA